MLFYVIESTLERWTVTAEAAGSSPVALAKLFGADSVSIAQAGDSGKGCCLGRAGPAGNPEGLSIRSLRRIAEQSRKRPFAVLETLRASFFVYASDRGG